MIKVNEIVVSDCSFFKEGKCLKNGNNCNSMCDYGAYLRQKEIERLKAKNEKLKRLINMHLTTFDKCCVNGLIMVNNMISEVLEDE